VNELAIVLRLKLEIIYWEASHDMVKMNTRFLRLLELMKLMLSNCTEKVK
jgi:hypothetical protein